ncbi:hypothetical protein [Kitasatospora mediocidica]|uniref:hypothetical protein n=1 Tax=Kitasatospora mediocidica TaxID=58352 RepID=UPI0012FBBBFD|nr:hypothetical protein [Kitasatospora mediocidica]
MTVGVLVGDQRLDAQVDRQLRALGGEQLVLLDSDRDGAGNTVTRGRSCSTLPLRFARRPGHRGTRVEDTRFGLGPRRLTDVVVGQRLVLLGGCSGCGRTACGAAGADARPSVS